MLRKVLQRGSSAALLLLIMFLGSLALWVGVPLGWLYIGSRVEGSTGSVGAALGIMMLGVILSIGVLITILAWLNRRHVELQEARGVHGHGGTALEAVLVVSAAVAVVSFAVWFFFFSGSEPFPVKISY